VKTVPAEVRVAYGKRTAGSERAVKVDPFEDCPEVRHCGRKRLVRSRADQRHGAWFNPVWRSGLTTANSGVELRPGSKRRVVILRSCGCIFTRRLAPFSGIANRVHQPFARPPADP
jgi:hypothetical protein